MPVQGQGPAPSSVRGPSSAPAPVSARGPLSVRVRRTARATVVAATVLATSGCNLLPYLLAGGGAALAARDPGGSSECESWAAASASDPASGVAAPGAPTPLEAVLHSGNTFGRPDDSWVETATGDAAADFTSGSATVHVVQAPDGTWTAVSGSSCGDGSRGPVIEGPIPAPSPS